MAGVVAIVGRANVGKSTIFNRIVGERISIVEDIAGVTRDRIYATASWLTKEFRLIDTGGIELKDASFTTQIKMQAEIAIEEADLIIFVVNGREGVTQEDEYVARLLQKTKKPILLAVNKIDDGAFINDIYDFYSLGIGDPIPVSGSHGIGIGDLLDEVIKKLDFTEEEFAEDEIRFSIIGRPNVGKSSLTNAILGEERVIVSNIEGTTRDAIDTVFEKDEKTMQKKEKELRSQFKYLDYARIIFLSAKTHQRVHQLFPLIQESFENSHKRVQTSVLNDVLVDAQAVNPTTTFNGGRLKIFYANQVSVCPPTFILFVNDPQYLHFSYKRYLENRLRDSFGFEGTPIHIICRKRD